MEKLRTELGKVQDIHKEGTAEVCVCTALFFVLVCFLFSFYSRIFYSFFPLFFFLTRALISVFCALMSIPSQVFNENEQTDFTRGSTG